MTERNGVPLWTVNPLPRETTSVPVEAVTVRPPTAALLASAICAVRVVAFVTVTLLMVIPAPKFRPPDLTPVNLAGQ